MSMISCCSAKLLIKVDSKMDFIQYVMGGAWSRIPVDIYGMFIVFDSATPFIYIPICYLGSSQ